MGFEKASKRVQFGSKMVPNKLITHPPTVRVHELKRSSNRLRKDSFKLYILIIVYFRYLPVCSCFGANLDPNWAHFGSKEELNVPGFKLHLSLERSKSSILP